MRRSDFDQMLLDEAVARGATLSRGKATRPIVDNGVVKGAQVRMAEGGEQTIQSEMLLECSGQATWLANICLTVARRLRKKGWSICCAIHNGSPI